MKQILLASILALLLTACQQNWRDFSGDNRSVAELRMDLAGCQQDNNDIKASDPSACADNGCAIAAGLANGLAKSNAIKTCMAAKGWEPVSAAEVKAAQAQTQQTRSDFKAGVKQCEGRYDSGDLKTHVELAKCINEEMTDIAEDIGYSRMDLVHELAAKRLELAKKVDTGRLTEAQAKNRYSMFEAHIKEVAQQHKEQDDRGDDVAERDR